VLFDAGLLPDREQRPHRGETTLLCPACTEAGVHVLWWSLADGSVSLSWADLEGPQAAIARRLLRSR
jgi:hypothetical protein